MKTIILFVDYKSVLLLLCRQGQVREAGSVAQAESRLLALGQTRRDLQQPHHDHVCVQLQHQTGEMRSCTSRRTDVS